MSNEPKHTYTRETLVDRIAELRNILTDDRTVIEHLTETHQLDAAMHLYKALQSLQAPK